MHLLHVYKLFPFTEDLEEYMNDLIWSDWPKGNPLQPSESGPLAGTLLAEPELDPQQWLLALHLLYSWPKRSDPQLLARELEIDNAKAGLVYNKTRAALEEQAEFYEKIAKSLGACVRCG